MLVRINGSKFCAALVVLLLTLAGAWPASSAEARTRPRAHATPITPVSPQDAAATRAYLEAGYAYVQAVVANLPASKAAVEGFASKVGGECAGVLTGAPSGFGFVESGPQSARQFAERRREDEQASTLREELGSALDMTLVQPDRQAALALAAAVMPLQWSNPSLTESVHLVIARFKERVEQPTPAVCADMKAWVISGYKTLSAETKEFRSRREVGPIHRDSRQPIALLLARYENTGDKALIRKTQQLELRQEIASLSPLETIERQLQRTLGVKEPVAEFVKKEKEARPITIAHGKTAAGEKYVAQLKRRSPHSREAQGGCPLSLSITVTINIRTNGIRGSEGFEMCISRFDGHAYPSVNCNAGMLTVTANTLPAARSVRLRLSDGYTITSRVLFVPKRLGGPAGFYYQVVRGPSPIPVALAELDAHGRTLRVVALPHVVECTKKPLKYFPGGIRTLVRDTVPGGPTFTIVGERYRFLGHTYFETKLHLEEPLEAPSGSGLLGSIGGGIAYRRISTGGSIIFSPRTRALEWQIEEGCKPHPYAILYSILKHPADTVLSRAAGTLTPWKAVPIPASLHAGGVLVYTVLPAPPEELILRAPDGHTISTEKLAPLAKEAAETCEGEAEG